MLTSGGTATSAEEVPVRVYGLRPEAQGTAAVFSALVAMGAYCLATAARGTYPFGPRSRAVNDLGNQFVPLHEHLWDLMHGQATGDLFFNWSSGYGVPFLADFFTYLMNPFSWLVGLFPRAAVQVPVFLVTLLSIGLATALMTVFLGRLHPGSPWLRALLAVGYGVSAWTVSDGFSDPMWMWGLVSLPVLGIVFDWCLGRRHWVAGTLLVTVCWAGNFYTAAMATIAMGLVLLVRLALDERPPRERGRVLLRAALMTATGVTLAAPVLAVTYRASKASQPAPPITYHGRPPVRDYLVHLLPGGPIAGAPRISVGLLPLLLVLTFPFMRRVPVKERALWLSLLLVVAVSYVWKPTILLWHGLTIPNGSPYRAAIAMTALLVSVAWLALAHRPNPRELLAGGGLLAALLLLVIGSAYLSAGDRTLILADSALVLGLLLLYRRRDDRRTRAAVYGALAGSVFLATAYNVFAVTATRDNTAWWQPKRTIDAQSLAAHTAVRRRDDWPATRTDPGPHGFADNDPLLLGGQGGSYYSSYVPAKTARALQGLGAGWYMQGRHTLSFDDPVGRAIMGVSSYIGPSIRDPAGFVEHRSAAPPVVTLRRGAAFDGPARDSSVFARQERVLGAEVYTVPAVVHAAGPAPTHAPDGGWRVPGTAPGAAPTTFTASCPPGDLGYLYTPWFAGAISANGATYQRGGVFRKTDNGILPVGRVPAGGAITLALSGPRTQDIPRFPVGCLSKAALSRAVAGLKATAPDKVTAGGHTIGATFRRVTTGTAVLAVPAVNGWRCSVDGRAAEAPGTLGGLMAVGLGDGGSRVACSFRTPGLRAGLLAGGAALAVLLAVAVGGLVRARQTRAATRDLR
ncbi:YfhO family protein [Streptomyces polygonati]|uniref:YfhO family protein n=1 Tax=Streptomyces polygonati TaxID=1617087 RepID=A0ABV8HZF6_9ACTN